MNALERHIDTSHLAISAYVSRLEKLCLEHAFYENYKVSEQLRQVPHCRPQCPALAKLGSLLPSTSATKHYLQRAVQ